MRALAGLVVVMLVLCAVTYADVGKQDGLSWNPDSTGSGHFNNPAAAYPYERASATADGWNKEDDPATTYVSYRGAWSGSGVYDYDDYKWIGTIADQASLKVICDIEMWASMSVSASEVYFHLGNENAHSMVAYISGSLASNNGQWIGLTKDAWGPNDQAKADALTFVEDGFGRTKDWFVAYQPTNVPPDIPLAYAMTEDGGTTWVPGGWSGGNNSQDWGYWWLLNNGEEGAKSFVWRLTISPKAYQEDGRYYLDPDIVAIPDM